MHYLNDTDRAATDDLLQICIGQGYVPRTCMMAGFIVWVETRRGVDPCGGCNVPRDRCGGRPKRGETDG
jgi:hypothetical protein